MEMRRRLGTMLASWYKHVSKLTVRRTLNNRAAIPLLRYSSPDRSALGKRFRCRRAKACHSNWPLVCLMTSHAMKSC
jgi:hypothetical protein